MEASGTKSQEDSDHETTQELSGIKKSLQTDLTIQSAKQVEATDFDEENFELIAQLIYESCEIFDEEVLNQILESFYNEIQDDKSEQKMNTAKKSHEKLPRWV